MSVAAENYDINQISCPIARARDDLEHSSQRGKIPDWSQVRRDKEKHIQNARKRGVTLGYIYDELDQKYMNESLLEGLIKKPIKRGRSL
jgi:hypothetical protein